mgnify:CR=1 FL=1
MFSQILAGEEQAALQAHAVLLQGDIQHPARPPGTGRRLHLPGTGLHQGRVSASAFSAGQPMYRSTSSKSRGERALITGYLLELDAADGATLSLICLATWGLFMV